MHQINRAHKVHGIRISLLSFVLGYLVFCGCSAGQPVYLPAKPDVDSVAVVERNDTGGGDAKAGTGLVDNTFSSSKSQELISQALLALSTMTPEQVSQIKSADFSDLSVKSRCGFVANEADTTALLNASGFTKEVQVIRFASSSESLTFSDCRCLVEKTAKTFGASLQPLSTL